MRKLGRLRRSGAGRQHAGTSLRIEELGVPVLFTEAARFALRRDFDLPATPIRMMLRKGKNPCEAP